MRQGCPTPPVSGGPQIVSQAWRKKPALWAVRSTGLLGPVESQEYPLAPHRIESLPGVGLDHDEARHNPVMLDVEGTQSCRQADRTRRNQGIEQAQIMREVIGDEIGQGTLAVGGGRPDHWQGGDQFQRLPHLAHILGVLNQLHDHQARDSRQFRQCGKPREGWSILPLNVNKHVGIEEIH
jgi:hypothetical protein